MLQVQNVIGKTGQNLQINYRKELIDRKAAEYFQQYQACRDAMHCVSSFNGICNSSFSGICNSSFSGICNSSFNGICNSSFSGICNSAAANKTNDNRNLQFRDNLNLQFRFLQKSLSLKPNSPKYHREYAYLLAESGTTDRALFHLQRARDLKKAHDKCNELGIGHHSIYRLFLEQYYTGMYHNFNRGFQEAEKLLAKDYENKAAQLRNSPVHTTNSKKLMFSYDGKPSNSAQSTRDIQPTLRHKNQMRRFKKAYLGIIMLFFTLNILTGTKTTRAEKTDVCLDVRYLNGGNSHLGHSTRGCNPLLSENPMPFQTIEIENGIDGNTTDNGNVPENGTGSAEFAIPSPFGGICNSVVTFSGICNSAVSFSPVSFSPKTTKNHNEPPSTNQYFNDDKQLLNNSINYVCTHVDENQTAMFGHDRTTELNDNNTIGNESVNGNEPFPITVGATSSAEFAIPSSRSAEFVIPSSRPQNHRSPKFKTQQSTATINGSVSLSNGVPVANALVQFESLVDDQYSFLLVTDANGLFDTANIETAIQENSFDVLKKSFYTFPQGGSQHHLVFNLLETVKNFNAFITIYNMQGIAVAKLNTYITEGTAHAFWDAKNNPSGVYVARLGAIGGKVVHVQSGPGAERRVSESIIGKMNEPGLKSTELTGNYSITVSPTDSSMIQFDPTTTPWDIQDGDNAIPLEVDPTGFGYVLDIFSNASNAQVSVSSGGQQVFSGSLDDAGTMVTDTAFLADSVSEFDFHASGEGLQDFDSTFSASWNLQYFNFFMDSIVENPVYNHVVRGEPMPEASVSVYDVNTDSLIGNASASDGLYEVVFENDAQQQDVRIEQSAPYVNTKSWNGTVTDTLTQDLTDVIAQYFIDVNTQDGSDISVTPRSTGTELNGASVNYESGVLTDSVDVTITNPDLRDTAFSAGVAYGLNDINVTLDSIPNYLLNDEIRGRVRRENYPYQGDTDPIYEARVIFEGVNVDHIDSVDMAGLYYELQDMKIPTNQQGEADTGIYVRTLKPTNYESYSFKEQKDTVRLAIDDYTLDPVIVQELDQNVTLTGTIRAFGRDTLSTNPLKVTESTEFADLDSISDVIVRFITPDSTYETTSDANGNYSIENVPCATTGTWEVGYTDTLSNPFFSNVGHSHTVKDEVVHPSDSVKRINWMMKYRAMNIPATENDPDYGNTVYATPDQISEMIRGPPSATRYGTVVEEALGRRMKINLGNLSSGEQDAMKEAIKQRDSLFYGIKKTVDINNEQRPFEIVYNHIPVEEVANYHPFTNPQTDSVGWNVYTGNNETQIRGPPVDNGKQYDEKAITGGEITVSFGDYESTIKEIEMRANNFNDVVSRPSIANMVPTYPTLLDRAIMSEVKEDNKARWNTDNTGTWYNEYPIDKLEYTISSSK